MHLALNGWFWNSPGTGSGQYTRQLVEALARLRRDLQITLVVPQDAPQDSEREEAALPSSCLLHPIPSSRTNPDKLRFEQVGFPRACRRTGAELAHVPYWAPPVHPSVPLVVTIHDLIPLILRRYRGGALQRLYTSLVSATARGAELVLTDSQASREDILERLALAPHRVRAVPLAVHERYHAQPAPDDAKVRAAYDLPDRYLLYLGGFDVRKNIATVLSAYRLAEPVIGEQAPLVIAGRLPDEDTPFTPHPRRLMKEQGLPDRAVRLIGFVEERDKPAVYRAALAFLFPSRYEGFGLPPLEALACGTPVVGSDAASLPEIVGDAGMLLPPDDARGMARTLIQLVLDEGFRADRSRRAVAQAARFSWQRTAEATLAAYGDALA